MMANSIKLKNGDQISIGSVVEVTSDEGYGLNVGDHLEVALWYPYYGETKLRLLKDMVGSKQCFDHNLYGLKLTEK